MSTVSVVATVEASNVPPRIRLDVTDTGTPNIFATTVTRLDPDGRAVPVRTIDGEPLALSTSGSNRVGVVYDYEAPFGESVTFSTLESPGLSSATVALPSTRPWLIHPGLPELSTPILIQSLGEATRVTQRGVFQPMGRKYPVVQTGGQRQAEEYLLTVLAMTVGELAALDTLLDDATTLLLNIPADKGWQLRTNYVSVGDVTKAPVTRLLSEATTSYQLPVTVVDRPAGGTQAERTLADLVEYGSLAGIAVAYDDLFDIAVGP